MTTMTFNSRTCLSLSTARMGVGALGKDASTPQTGFAPVSSVSARFAGGRVNMGLAVRFFREVKRD